MKSKIAPYLIILGLLILIGHGVYKTQKVNTLLENQIITQQTSVVQGLKLEWRKFLLNKIKNNELRPHYALEWNRTGIELKDEYFPLKASNLNWSYYRKIDKILNKTQAQEFLRTALERDNSWDRVLAILEWKKMTGEAPLHLNEYEKTLLFSEARVAYREIFEQFSIGKDFTFTTEEIILDKVFYKLTPQSTIIAFLPSAKEVKEKFLSEFSKMYKISSVNLTDNPLELNIDSVLFEHEKNSLQDIFVLVLGVLFLLLGLFSQWIMIREQRKILIKKVTFLNQVVHELKTPLTGLKLNLQLFQKGLFKEDNIVNLNKSIDRINTLFDDVVLMNSREAKNVCKVIRKDEVVRILNGLVEEFKTVEIQEIELNGLYADDKRLRIILRNLVKNAIKYGECCRIKISSNTESSFFYIEDDGPGVSLEDSRKIFQEFFRSESAKFKHTDGLGIGLYLARKLVHEMDGKLDLMNPGRPKAVFRVTLKAAV